MSLTKRLVLLFPVALVGVVLLYFSENIRGYYRFKQLCETEGGLRVFHPLQKGVGWLAKKGDGEAGVSRFQHVAFVRYSDGGRMLDIRYRTGPTWDKRSYDIAEADELRPVVYKLRSKSERVAGELRTSRTGYEVVEIATGQLMLRWYQIGYSTFNQDRTFLGAPSGQACHGLQGFFDPSSQVMYFMK